MELHDLPAVNATLNGITATLLCTGYVFIRKHRIAAHRACMIAACCASALFLGSYLYYHFRTGSRRFEGEGWLRPGYFAILISHTILAAAVVPLALVTLYRGLTSQHPKHERIARWTLPIWLYVSVTGVVVYVLLYRLRF